MAHPKLHVVTPDPITGEDMEREDRGNAEQERLPIDDQDAGEGDASQEPELGGGPTAYQQSLAAILERIDRWTSGEIPTAAELRERYPLPEGHDFVRSGFVRDYLPASGSAPDLEAIAAYLCTREPLRFSHLAGVSVDYLWRCEGGNSQGRPTLGKCRMARTELLHYAGVTYIIWLAADNHEVSEATWEDVISTVRHELGHTGTNSDGKFVVKPHEFEGFLFEFDGERIPKNLRLIPQQLGLQLKW